VVKEDLEMNFRRLNLLLEREGNSQTKKKGFSSLHKEENQARRTRKPDGGEIELLACLQGRFLFLISRGGVM